ncbi:MAG: ankyrin repeat domain-containing protein, partial [Candidatus Sericytochromatia bacterium]
MKHTFLAILVSSCLIISSCSSRTNLLSNINKEKPYYQDLDEAKNLINAINNDDVKKVKDLLDKGANIQIRNSKGQDLLAIASLKGNKEIVELICKKALMDFFLFNKQKKLSEYFLLDSILSTNILYRLKKTSDDYKDFINNDKNYQNSAIISAIKSKNDDLFFFLVNQGANIDDNFYYEQKPIMLAIENERKKIIDYLIDKNNTSNIDNSSYRDNNALMLASYIGDIETVKLLISKEAKLDKTNIFGNTPLMLASTCNNNDLFQPKDNLIKYIDVINILIKNSNNVNTKNKLEQTSLMLASQHCPKEISKI